MTIPLRAQVRLRPPNDLRNFNFQSGIQLYWLHSLHVSNFPRFAYYDDIDPIRVVFVAVYYNNIWQAQNFPFVGLIQRIIWHALIALYLLALTTALL